MKLIVTILVFLTAGFVFSQQTNDAPKKQLVEAACGQCQFGLESKKGCDLAVRIHGKSYFVEGSKIDDHGDAHAKDGMCTTIRKAEVTGAIIADKFVATSFKLLPDNEKK